MVFFTLHIVHDRLLSQNLQPGNPKVTRVITVSKLGWNFEKSFKALSPPSVSSERERCRACEEKADTRPCFRICPPDNYIIGAPGHEGRERSVSRQFGQTPLIGRPGRMPSCTFRTIFLGKFLDKHRKRLERASINYRAAKEICPENFITFSIVSIIITKKKSK